MRIGKPSVSSPSAYFSPSNDQFPLRMHRSTPGLLTGVRSAWIVIQGLCTRKGKNHELRRWLNRRDPYSNIGDDASACTRALCGARFTHMVYSAWRLAGGLA